MIAMCLWLAAVITSIVLWFYYTRVAVHWTKAHYIAELAKADQQDVVTIKHDAAVSCWACNRWGDSWGHDYPDRFRAWNHKGHVSRCGYGSPGWTNNQHVFTRRKPLHDRRAKAMEAAKLVWDVSYDVDTLD